MRPIPFTALPRHVQNFPRLFTPRLAFRFPPYTSNLQEKSVLLHYQKHAMSSSSGSEGYRGDEWPILPNGQEYNGLDLLALVRNGHNLFKNLDVNLVIREVEDALGATIADIPTVTKGSNNLVRRCSGLRKWRRYDAN